LTAESIYGGTVTNVKRKRVPGGGSSYSKTTRAKACVDMWDSQQTTESKSLYMHKRTVLIATVEQTWLSW